MALLQPPITGDAQQDSWALQLTNQINQGLVPGGVVSGSGGGGGTGTGTEGGNSSIYLYQTTLTTTPVPNLPNDVSYNFANLSNPVTVNDTASGWSPNLPSNDGSAYIWATFRYISGESGEITDTTSWNTPAIISAPAASAFSIETTYRVPANDLTTDPTDWDFHPDGRDFIDGMGAVKALVPTVYLNGTQQSFAAHSGYTYSWTRNGQTFTPTNGDVNQRVLRIVFADLTDATDQFICVINTN